MHPTLRALIGALALLHLLPACQSPPGCAYRGLCGDPGEAKVCLSFCEPTATAVMVDTGEVRCALDPCAPGAYDDPDIYACPADHRCVPGIDGDGRCAPLPRLGERCGALLEPAGAFEACAGGLACVESACPGAASTNELLGLPPLGPDGVHAGAARCLPPAREGDVCDSNLLDDEPGCRPCEIGFQCLDAEPFGLATAEGQRRCLRACETREGEVDPGLCRCGDDVSCEEHPDPTGEARHFCRPCAGNNEQSCAGDNEVLECCDAGRGAECQPVAPRAEADPSGWRCCLALGADTCGLERGPNAGCCPGTLCTAEGCQPCGRAGEEPVDGVGCCEGHVVRRDGFGNVSCEPCRSLDGTPVYCGNGFLETLGADGERSDWVSVPSRDLPFRSVRPVSGGELLHTAGQVARVRYRLDGRHRAYLFRESLVEDSGEPARRGRGTEVLRLPASRDDEVTFDLDDPSWAAARVVDLGECSAFLDYERLNNMIALTLLQDSSLAKGITGMRSLSFKRVWTEPFFGQSALEPIETPLGIQHASDELKITIKLRANIKSCVRDTDIEYVARARLVAEPPRIAVGATAVSDALLTDPLTAVRCTPAGAGWSCRLIDQTDALGRPTRTRLVEFTNTADFSPVQLADLASASCSLDGGSYVCLEPQWAGDRLIDPILREVRYDRPLVVDFSRERVRVVLLSEDLSLPNTCYLSAIIAPVLRRKIREALVGENGSLPERIERFFDDTADRLGVRPRRVELLPEGLVIVVAERNDPQVADVRELVEEDRLVGRLVSCDEVGAPEAPRLEPEITTVTRAQTVGPEDDREEVPRINTRKICSLDAEGCDGICSEFGVPCDQTLVPLNVFGTVGPGAGELCFSGQCCREEDTCDGVCDIDFRNDPNHCGGCGEACEGDDACIDGVCQPCPNGSEGQPLTHCVWDQWAFARAQSMCRDLSSGRTSCGSCWSSCGAEERCEEGRCVR